MKSILENKVSLSISESYIQNIIDQYVNSDKTFIDTFRFAGSKNNDSLENIKKLGMFINKRCNAGTLEDKISRINTLVINDNLTTFTSKNYANKKIEELPKLTNIMTINSSFEDVRSILSELCALLENNNVDYYITIPNLNRLYIDVNDINSSLASRTDMIKLYTDNENLDKTYSVIDSLPPEIKVKFGFPSIITGTIFCNEVGTIGYDKIIRDDEDNLPVSEIFSNILLQTIDKIIRKNPGYSDIIVDDNNRKDILKSLNDPILSQAILQSLIESELNVNNLYAGIFNQNVEKEETAEKVIEVEEPKVVFEEELTNNNIVETPGSKTVNEDRFKMPEFLEEAHNQVLAQQNTIEPVQPIVESKTADDIPEEVEKVLSQTQEIKPLEDITLNPNEVNSISEEKVNIDKDYNSIIDEFGNVFTDPTVCFELINNPECYNKLLIDYLMEQNVLQTIPLNSKVTTVNNGEMIGEEFIKNIMVPQIKEGRTINEIISMETKNIQKVEVKKKGFLGRMFGKIGGY